jgi:hypothetical protein
VVRFWNKRAAGVWVWPLSYEGTYDGDGMRVPPGEERTADLANTWVGRHFVIRSVPGGDRENIDFDLYLVTAAATPGRATITESE